VIRAWRLARRAHSEPPGTAAFNGRGAELFGDRWNPVGLAAAYASQSRALSALEYLVHLDRDLVPDDLVFSQVEFEDSDVETAAPPADWNAAGSPSAVAYGERWLRDERSLVLAVPSVIVRGEQNFVINPRHRRASSLIISPALEPFVYDARLLRA
jgi:RES domain-containing protein